ncbi:MAG: DUF192 domain-containing protein [Patescibacteria group bacterium]
MKNKKIIILGIILIIFIFFIVLVCKNNSLNTKVNNLEINYVKIASQIIKVDVVSTPELLEKGLSGRENLEENEGMLFVFPNNGLYSFWMKDMNFAIDIIWLDESKKIIFIKKNVFPDTYPETFLPEKKSKYVLEVIAGFAEKNNLEEGNFVEFLP